MTAVAHQHAHVAAPVGPLTGTRQIVRLVLRRDRFPLLVWILLLGVLPMGVASASDQAYPTEADRLAFAATAAVNPAELATRGPVFAATTGGFTAWTLASSGVLICGVVSLLLVVRHTRAEEQAGRRELIGAGVLGRHAPLAGVFAVVVTANVAVAALAALSMIGSGLPAVGSVALGMGIGAGGAVFAAVGAVTAQLTDGSGGARGLALTVLGALFAVAAVGEVGRSGLVWASPFGWVRRVQAFADERWAVLLLFVALAAVLVAAAFALSARRDVGAGVLPARSGPASASRALRTPHALAWRLHRGSVIAWTAGCTILGLLLGAAMASLGDQLDTPAFRELSSTLGGGDPPEVFFRFMLYVLAQVVAASAIAAALRMRGEETSGLADVVLTAPVGRLRWALGHLSVTGLSVIAVLAGLGLGAGVAYGTPLAVLGTTLSYVPACLVFAGLVVALYGWVPALAAPVAWAVLGVTVLLDLLGEFRLVGPEVMAISPFVRTIGPLATGAGLGSALLGLLAVAVLLATIGLAGLGRRDISER